jgi:hypothetical protein
MTIEEILACPSYRNSLCGDDKVLDMSNIAVTTKFWKEILLISFRVILHKEIIGIENLR